MQQKFEESLQQVITFQDFLLELEELKAWISHNPRKRSSWYWSAVQFFEGNR